MEDMLIITAARLGALLRGRNKSIAVAESCTGGLIAQALTELAGSSVWFERGFVTYSNASKIQLLNVQAQTLECYGAVSAETALEMAAGALAHSEADYVLAVTGIAGPGGGSAAKPVGTVFIARAAKGQAPDCEQQYFEGDRHTVRYQTALRALQYWVEVLERIT
jgi:nicotinamide-nucleotide amidase